MVHPNHELRTPWNNLIIFFIKIFTHFTDKGDSQGPADVARDVDQLMRREWKLVVAEIRAGAEFLQDGSTARSLERQQTGLLRSVDQLHVEAAIVDAPLEVRPRLVGRTAAGCHVESSALEARLPRSRLRTVDKADRQIGFSAGALVQHAGVRRLAAMPAHVVGEDPVGRFLRVPSRQIVITKIGHVEYCRPFASGPAFVFDLYTHTQKRLNLVTTRLTNLIL